MTTREILLRAKEQVQKFKSNIETKLLIRHFLEQDFNYFLLHGNFQITTPGWENHFKKFLVKRNVAEERIYTPRLRHLFAYYPSWLKDPVHKVLGCLRNFTQQTKI